MSNNKPVGRKEDIIVQDLDNEVLIYDLNDNRAMCLNETSAAVWRACDGRNSVADIVKSVGNDDVVWLALAELKKEKLIDYHVETPAKFDGLSRREVIKTIGISS